ncbi:MAG TPA: crotonase/enoyl-CoA hydratase family protein [Acidimicrobiales bacterium]|nr:crotonase/enoyl-CoA hydratase family protein [Acidimicrobiales bacterium]
MTAAYYEHISYEVEDGIALVTLDRPDQLNAFTTRMMHELIDAFDRSDADDSVRAVIVTGQGRGFCAGADLSSGPDTFARSDDSSPVGVGWRDGGGQVVLRIFESRKPVIAAINGPAVGVGITMTLPMDVRLAADDARMGFVFTRRGLVPEACSSWFLPRVVGISRAAEWVFTGRVFPATEALDAGLVRSLHPKDELLAAARALATEMSQQTAPVSVALSRLMLWRMLGASHPMEAHRVDSRGIRVRGASDDAREGVAAFLEKREAVFPLRVSADLPDIFPDWSPPEFS